jgi:hypothetical protein
MGNHQELAIEFFLNLCYNESRNHCVALLLTSSHSYDVGG